MRRAGPLVWIGFEGTEAPNDVLALVRDGDLGGVILFARNLRDVRQTRELTRTLHEARPIPIAVDQEGGDIARIGFGTLLPSAMAFGATRDPALAERAAATVARELRSLGIGVLLAPVCDVNVEPRNPVIGTRSFSDDPALCAELAAAWVRGAQGEGVACVAKHFPGHGATREDSHRAVPVVSDAAPTILQRELAPFRAAIDAHVAAVMTAHVRYPAFDGLVATYSPALLRRVLRNELGFDGLVVSDSLTEMEGARAGRPSEAIAAGVDIALLSRREAYDGTVDDIERCCTEELVPGERIADALRRARAFSTRWAAAPSGEPLRSSHDLALEVASRAITHVGPPLPDLRAGPVLCAAFSHRGRSVEGPADPIDALERALRERLGARLTVARDPGPLEVPAAATLVIVTANAFFDERQASRARALAGHRPTVLCALRSPYDAALFPQLPALLTYADVPASCEALARVLLGERPAEGRLPVRLPAR